MKTRHNLIGVSPKHCHTHLSVFCVFFFTSLMLLSVGKNVVSWSLHFKQFSKYLLIVSHTVIKSAAVTKMKGSHSCSERIHSLVEETNNYYSRQTIIFKMVKSNDLVMGSGSGLPSSESFLCQSLVVSSWEVFLISLYVREVNQHIL